MKQTLNKSKQAIIFDFDGTIADSFDMFLEALGVVLKRSEQVAALTPAEVDAMRKASTREVLKGLGIRPWQVPVLLSKGRREISARMDRVHIFEGMPEALRQLASQHSIYILSTNSQENIIGLLKRYNLEGFITGVYGDIGLMGKASNLRKLQRKEGLNVADCIYIGDETRDIDAARKVGVKFIAVSWGYTSVDTLESHSPDGIAKTPKNLVEVVREQMA